LSIDDANFGQKTSEVKERPRLITAGYGWHRSQRVNHFYKKKALVNFVGEILFGD